MGCVIKVRKRMATEYMNISLDDVTYYEKVVDLANSNSEELISNSNINHAKILIHQLLIRAKKSIRILSSRLDTAIYDDQRILDALESLVKRQIVKIEVLIQFPEKIEKANKFLEICRGYFNCVIKKVRNPKDEQLNSHYIIMDEKAYRFCADAIPENGSVKAFATFNDPAMANRLTQWFNKFFNTAEEVKFSLN